MKEWPDSNRTASFSDLQDEIVQAIHFAYNLQRKNHGKDIPLAGPDAPETESNCSGSLALTAEQLKFSREDQGRDALTEIVGVAIRLGIEQGRRIAAATYESKIGHLETRLSGIKTLATLKE